MAALVRIVVVSLAVAASIAIANERAVAYDDESGNIDKRTGPEAEPE